MKKRFLIISICTLFIHLSLTGQDNQVQKTLVLTSAKTKFKFSERLKEQNLNTILFQDMAMTMKNIYNVQLVLDDIPMRDKEHARYLIKLLDELCLQYYSTYDFNEFLFARTKMDNNNDYNFLPIIYNRDYTTEALDGIAKAEDASYIIYADSISFEFNKRKVTIKPQLNLYDCRNKKLIITPADSIISSDIFLSEDFNINGILYNITTEGKNDFNRIKSFFFEKSD